MPRNKGVTDYDDIEAELIDAAAECVAAAPPVPAIAADAKARVRQKLRQRVGNTPIFGAYTLHADDGEWLPVAPGIHKKQLHCDESGDNDMYLLRLESGAVLPSHVHDKTERCLVVEGDMDFDGTLIRAGDFHIIAAGASHPAGTSRSGAVLLINTM